ncbi:MAG: hypothetical protein ABR607_02110 [Pyrinomonadaceae bacterium]
MPASSIAEDMRSGGASVGVSTTGGGGGGGFVILRPDCARAVITTAKITTARDMLFS